MMPRRGRHVCGVSGWSDTDSWHRRVCLFGLFCSRRRTEKTRPPIQIDGAHRLATILRTSEFVLVRCLDAHRTRPVSSLVQRLERRMLASQDKL
jgi:hypothetical protein